MCRTSRGPSGLNGQVVQRNTGTFALWDSACAARHCTAVRQPTYAVRDAIWRQPELHRWITAQGREKLRAYGIAPPIQPGTRDVECPQCRSVRTVEMSRFGSTPCKAQWRCLDCLEPFDLFKCH